MRVEWSELANEDLAYYVEYISRDSVFYANQFAERIVLATRRLSDFPKSGREIPEADDELWREIIVQGYRVMYHLDPDRVLILAVIDGSRDLTNSKNQPWNF